MGPVEIAIRRNVHEGDLLSTPSQAAPFSVGKISGDGVVLELGEKRTPTFFRWDCLEGIVPFLQRHGRVRVNGSGKSTEIVEGTLDGYPPSHAALMRHYFRKVRRAPNRDPLSALCAPLAQSS